MTESSDSTHAGAAIRPFQAADTEAVVAITVEVFGPASIDAKIEAMLGRPAAPWAQVKSQAVRGELRANPAGCFVAEIDGRVVGFITTAVNLPASRGWIPNVAVAADCQGLGLGRRLLERALEHFRSLGLAQAKIETLATNPVGRHLYPQLGFQEVARQVHYVMRL